MSAGSQSFDMWWEELCYLARKNGWQLSNRQEYREYYDDGDSAEDALFSEMNYEPDGVRL